MMNKCLRLSVVKELTGLSRSSIYLRISEQRFPKPINLGGRAVAWLERDIDTWIEQQVKQSHQQNRGKQ